MKMTAFTIILSTCLI